MDYLMLGKVEFEFFVMSVLRQIAARTRQEITFGKIISAYTENKASDKYLKFDAVAPNGFGDFKGCIYFEFKKLQKRSSTEAKSIESFRRKIRTVNWDQAAIGILIVDGRIRDSITYDAAIDNELPIYVWVSKLLSSGFESIPSITVTQLTYQTKRQIKNYQLMTIFQTLQKMTLQKRNGKISIL